MLARVDGSLRFVPSQDGVSKKEGYSFSLIKNQDDYEVARFFESAYWTAPSRITRGKLQLRSLPNVSSM